jgi:hypothetical protein
MNTDNTEIFSLAEPAEPAEKDSENNFRSI